LIYESDWMGCTAGKIARGCAQSQAGWRLT